MYNVQYIVHDQFFNTHILNIVEKRGGEHFCIRKCGEGLDIWVQHVNCATMHPIHGRMNYKDTEPYLSAILSN